MNTNITGISVLVSLILFLTFPYVHGNYECLCNNDIETTVFSGPSNSTSPLGFLYEFDCKPMDKAHSDATWAAILFEHQIGYVRQGASIAEQACSGSIPSRDVITTIQTPPTNVTRKTATTKLLSTIRSTTLDPFTQTTSQHIIPLKNYTTPGQNLGINSTTPTMRSSTIVNFPMTTNFTQFQTPTNNRTGVNFTSTQTNFQKTSKRENVTRTTLPAFLNRTTDIVAKYNFTTMPSIFNYTLANITFTKQHSTSIYSITPGSGSFTNVTSTLNHGQNMSKLGYITNTTYTKPNSTSGYIASLTDVTRMNRSSVQTLLPNTSFSYHKTSSLHTLLFSTTQSTQKSVNHTVTQTTLRYTSTSIPANNTPSLPHSSSLPYGTISTISTLSNASYQSLFSTTTTNPIVTLNQSLISTTTLSPSVTSNQSFIPTSTPGPIVSSNQSFIPTSTPSSIITSNQSLISTATPSAIVTSNQSFISTLTPFPIVTTDQSLISTTTLSPIVTSNQSLISTTTPSSIITSNQSLISATTRSPIVTSNPTTMPAWYSTSNQNSTPTTKQSPVLSPNQSTNPLTQQSTTSATNQSSHLSTNGQTTLSSQSPTTDKWIVELYPYYMLSKTIYNGSLDHPYPLVRTDGYYCYELSIGVDTWFNARATCREKGGDLVVINAKGTEMLILTMLKELNYTEEVWIGLTNLNDVGKWKWVDGQAASTTYANWDTSPFTDPESDKRRNCVTLDVTSGKWRTRACQTYIIDVPKHYAICQYEIPKR